MKGFSFALKAARQRFVRIFSNTFSLLWQSFFFCVILKVATYKIYKPERDKPVDVVLALSLIHI